MLTKDHIYPRSKGGLNDIRNYQVLCSTCNEKKSDESPMTLVQALREGKRLPKSFSGSIILKLR